MNITDFREWIVEELRASTGLEFHEIKVMGSPPRQGYNALEHFNNYRTSRSPAHEPVYTFDTVAYEVEHKLVNLRFCFGAVVSNPGIKVVTVSPVASKDKRCHVEFYEALLEEDSYTHLEAALSEVRTRIKFLTTKSNTSQEVRKDLMKARRRERKKQEKKA